MDPIANKKRNMQSVQNLATPWLWLAYPAILLVRCYQFFSPIKKIILGPYAACRFHPSCSDYTLECLKTFSLPVALYKSLTRILRCNPMHPGGYDPVIKSDCSGHKHE